MQKTDDKQQNQSDLLNFDLIGWSVYAISLITSLFGFRSQGTLIGTTGLVLVMFYYLQKPPNDLLALKYATREQLNVGLLLAFALLLFLKFVGVAFLCLGANFFLFGCLSLKQRKIYVGSNWRLEERACYTGRDHPMRYWLWTSMFLFLGYLLLVYPLLMSKWFIA